MVDANNHKRGILIDLDIAARTRDGNNRFEPTLTHAGTLGFRSIDLLRTDTHYPTRAMYRDDLESFYYVLFFIARYYRDGVRLPIHNHVGWWDERWGIKGIADVKRGLQTEPNGEGLPDSPLSDSWLRPLRHLFRTGYLQNRRQWRDQEEQTMGGHVTFHSFFSIISIS